MNSSKDKASESDREKSSSATNIAEKTTETLEMERALADDLEQDTKSNEGNSASGDHTVQDNVIGNNSKDEAGSSKQDEDYIRFIGKETRNPITGLGLNGDGVGGLKSKRPKAREGNPVTGEGYKPGSNDFLDKHNNADKNNDKNSRGSSGGRATSFW